MDGEDRWSEEFVRVREIGKELSGGQAGGRHAEIGSNFGERDQDERALGEAWMRNFEGRLGEDQIAIEEDVEIERTRAVGDGGGAVAAEDALDG